MYNFIQAVLKRNAVRDTQQARRARGADVDRTPCIILPSVLVELTVKSEESKAKTPSRVVSDATLGSDKTRPPNTAHDPREGSDIATAAQSTAGSHPALPRPAIRCAITSGPSPERARTSINHGE